MDNLPALLAPHATNVRPADAGDTSRAADGAANISPKKIGIGIAFAAGIGYAIRRSRRHKSRPVVQARTKKSTDEDRVSLPHQVMLFLKVLLPLVLADDAPKAQVVVSPPIKAVALPPQIQKDAVPDVAKIAPGNRLQQSWQLTKAAINAWLDDFAPSMGAAIAYYTIFSIAPMLVIAIAVAGLIFGQDAAQGEIVGQLRGIIGIEGATAIQGLLKSASKPASGVIATTISIVTLGIGATAVFAELQSALDRIWRVPVAVKESGIWALVRTRLLSFGMILGLGFMLMVSLVVSAGLAALGNWWSGWFEGWEVVLQILNLVLSFFVFAALFSVIYKFMPRVRLSWHDVWIGAVATTVLFIIGKYLIGLYLGKTGMTSGFGAAGSFALLLAWVYYSAQIFLLGAEFTWIYANNYGSKSKAVAGAAA
jgi:YihY family inner membrane protein